MTAENIRTCRSAFSTREILVQWTPFFYLCEFSLVEEQFCSNWIWQLFCL